MNSKLSGAQGRKRRAKDDEDARKSSRLLAAFVIKEPKTDEDATLNLLEVLEMSSDLSDSEDDSDGDGNESPESEHPEREDQAAVLVFTDIGYINFTATGTPSVDQKTKERMIEKGASAF
jgi:hypothetical protein